MLQYILACEWYLPQARTIPFILYFKRPPLFSSDPSTSYAGRTAHSAKLSPYQPNVPSAPSTLIKPANPGHPVSCFKVSSPCCHPDLVDNNGAENNLRGESSEGAGQPVTSLQRKAKA